MLVENSVLVEMLPGVLRTAVKQQPQNVVSIDKELLSQNAVASVVHHGNFTIAMIDLFGKIFIGEAKRNPLDTPNTKRGDRLALSRALKALILDESTEEV